jgi:hypothetical protein
MAAFLLSFREQFCCHFAYTKSEKGLGCTSSVAVIFIIL